MPHASINMSDQMKAECDDRRHSTVSRSEYVREALRARFYLENTGRWDDVLDDADWTSSDAVDATAQK